ncbi:hypothetical protein A2291_01005 [candidate division WOR-1 bacterium RIFOXYB2_FULL_42_35]|nr:MAG: hypothetical protein A2291_01005 [candidate division WOR-1 bacterium RIFOXYB2_FULL_42_35]
MKAIKIRQGSLRKCLATTRTLKTILFALFGEVRTKFDDIAAIGYTIERTIRIRAKTLARHGEILANRPLFVNSILGHVAPK